MPLHVQLAAAAFLALLFFGLTGWLNAFAAWRRGEPLLPYEPRRPVPWTLLDLLAVFATYLITQAAAGVLLRQWLGGGPISLEDASADQLTALLLAQGAANLATGVLAVLGIVIRTHANSGDIGWSLVQLANDVRIGVVAFFMLALPVLVIQAALVQWMPSEHPLIMMLRDHSHPWLFVASVFIAVIVAPLFEELIFRVLLQGWLEKPRRVEVPLGQPVENDSMPSDPAQAPYWPIFVSAAVFALLHLGHGPDPIPLFVLALGLGYLYRQTHRLAPSMTVHLLLNGMSMLMLWAEINYGGS
jgi:membrane protease YdiL (CAAX protease family)